MGYNTSILLLNDATDMIQKNPIQFTENVVKMMSGGFLQQKNRPLEPGDSLAVGNHLNPMSLISRDHADTINLVAIGHNFSSTLLRSGSCSYGSFGDKETNIKLLKEAANELGFNLTRKPAKAI